MEAQRQFDALMVETDDEIFFQPCFSPVWDTAIAAYALGESGCAPQDALDRMADWLLTKEVRRKGDWSIKRPNVEPSGLVLRVCKRILSGHRRHGDGAAGLMHARATTPGAQEACAKRAVNWLMAMQSKDGGWAAFDVDNNWEFLSYVPFADHNAMLDPSCPDITGRVLEALCEYGLSPDHQAVRRGSRLPDPDQEQDGSWYGRWGVNYIYGTFLALRGLKAPG